MINYIVQVIVFQTLFLLIYDVFLSKETFFTKNRGYLLGTFILSFIVPLIKITPLKKVVPQELVVYIPEINLSQKIIIKEPHWYTSFNYTEVIFAVGVFVFTLLFITKLYHIIQLINTCKKEIHKEYTLIILPKGTKAFSFFNYIFLGKDIKRHQKDKIIAHELIHSKQKHSIDLLFLEILKTIMWFNPLIYFYQKRITLVHEYITDAKILELETEETYINNLLSNFFQVDKTLFINQFYKHTLIKKRIIMMKKNESKKVNQLKYLVLVPALIAMLTYISCSEKQAEEVVSTQELGLLKTNQKTKSTIAIAPTFPGCQTGDKTCFNTEIKKYISENFNTKLPNQLGLEPGTKKVYIAFNVDKDGTIVNIRARAPHAKIEEEAIRVITTLPKMLPGKKEGNTVVVGYAIPFVIKID